MPNTRPLPPADINPWAKSIEADVDRLLVDTSKATQDAATALRTANAAIDSLTASYTDLGDVPGTDAPAVFPLGLSLGNATGDEGYPAAGLLLTVEVVKWSNTRCVQRIYEKGDSTLRRYWYRSAVGTTGEEWGRWVTAGGESGWTDISGSFLSATVEVRALGDNVLMRGTTETDVAIGTGLTNIASVGGVPSAWRPTANTWGSAYNAGMSMTALIRTDGSVALSNRNASAITGTISFSISYFLN
jgi:hypothetical protein